MVNRKNAADESFFGGPGMSKVRCIHCGRMATEHGEGPWERYLQRVSMVWPVRPIPVELVEIAPLPRIKITRAATPSEPVLDAWTGAQALAEREWR